MQRMRFFMMGVILAGGLFFGGCDTEGLFPQGAMVTNSTARALGKFNRGAALLEQYSYKKSAAAFEEVLQIAPDWTTARYNLGLAYLNMQGQSGARENLKKAAAAFEAVLQQDPDHFHARFCLGLYHQHIGENEKALKCFERVYQADREDPYVGYKYAESLIGLDRNAEAIEVLAEVLEVDPGFISAVYRLALMYQRNRQREKALPLFERFKQLKEAELTGGSFTVLKAYGTVGKYYMALGADDLPLSREQKLTGQRILFSPEVRSFGAPVKSQYMKRRPLPVPGIACGDVDKDGDTDLCVTAAGEEGQTCLWMNDGAGNFSRGQVLGKGGVSPCFGDVDNDGDLDLWLGRDGKDMYYENDGTGRFSPIDLQADTPNAATSCSRLADVDSDGDLDLMSFGLRGAGSQEVASGIWNNNRDGTYEDIAERLGLRQAGKSISTVVCDDFDNDRDLDMVLFPFEGDAVCWVNDRAWQYRLMEGPQAGLKVDAVLGATSGDPDKDGDRDLLVFGRGTAGLFLNDGAYRFEPDEEFAERFGRIDASGGQFADMDNDGDLDIMIADALRAGGKRGPVVLVNDWPEKSFTRLDRIDPGNLPAAISFENHASSVAADLTGNGRCDILLVPVGDKPILVENVTQGNHWIEIDLAGMRTKDKKSRSNNSAIGARVEIKTGPIFQQYVVGVPSGAVAMAPLRIHAGLGRYSKVDWLRILWPDAVLQAELEIAGNRVMQVSEVQRKTSSCPHLFAWDGHHFAFVADFGGMGGSGYLVEPGVYARPDPTEYVTIPKLEPLNGEYVLQVLEPLEEVVFMDEVALLAVDHPADTTVYPNEMMAINAQPPAFELFCYRQEIDAILAKDHRGQDVTDALRHIDRRYAGATDIDERFTGYAETHLVDLDFGDQLASLAEGRRLVLFLHGWVEYPYSTTNFAAHQAQVRLKAPSISVRRRGQWVELFDEVGYPAGLQHMMTLDVTGRILPTDRLIRISSNMELYWDRIFLATVLDESICSLQSQRVSSADLHYLGYPREYSPDGRHPKLYDYGSIDGTVAWKIMKGDYTRYGEVAQLLEDADDCFVVMGRGEELTLCFPAGGFGPVPQGCRRSFILKTDSFCKDMDIYSAHPDTVEPLPFHSMSTYPYGANEKYPDDEKRRRYRRKFNTRRVGGPPN